MCPRSGSSSTDGTPDVRGRGPGLRQAFDVESRETRLERRTLYFDAVTGWRFVDLCDLCGGDMGYLDDPQALAALCGPCDELEQEESRTTDGSLERLAG